MPISKDEFIGGEKRDILEERILGFFKANPSSAYTAKETFDEMIRGGHLTAPKDTEERYTGWVKLHTKLEQLAMQTKVQSKTIYSRGNPETYYLFKP